MPTIIIDGIEHEVGAGRNVLQAALDNKLDLPYFCWHPAMGSVGACRLCAVKQYRDETDQDGRLVMGCMTPATDGTRVSIDDAQASEFRRSVIEWLMINHPHDCPVCDEGGECHLQDMTVMTGHARRRYRGTKRTHRNQYLGPLIHHEMNRCIQCYRCVRFYDEHSGGDDLGVFSSRERVYFGRVTDGVLESPFAGNLVEVCPTGVFTDKTYRRHYTRKWDLESAPSICTQCGLGCNTIVGARYGTVRRVTSRFNGEVNGYWICDRGRFGYEFAAASDRLAEARGLDDDGNIAGLAEAAAAGRLAAVGSPRASLETNFALLTLVGRERFCGGVAAPQRRMLRGFAAAARSGRVAVPSLSEVENADVVVVLGSDPTHEAPLLDLALYRARQSGARIFIAGLGDGRVAGFAESAQTLDPRQAAVVAHMVARSLQTESGGGIGGLLGDGNGAGATGAEFAENVAAALTGAERPLVVCGTRHRDVALFEAALGLAVELGPRRGTAAQFALVTEEANDLGLALLEGEGGLDVGDLLAAIETKAITALVVCENDLFDRYDDPRRVVAALKGLERLVVADYLPTSTAALATHVLPVATAVESTGTLLNNEGRLQRFYEVLPSPAGVAPGWSVVRDLGTSFQAAAGTEWKHVEDVTEALAAAFPELVAAVDVAPPADFRYESQAIPRMSQRASGRNATLSADALRDPDRLAANALPPQRRPRSADAETPFRFSMEGYNGPAPSSLIGRVWSPGWNSSEAINQFQIEVGGALHGGDPGRRIFAAPGGLHPGGPPQGAVAGTTARGEKDDIPPERPADELLVCAVAEIFGSEATSRRSPAIAELAPRAYLQLNPERAAALGIEIGTTPTVELRSADSIHRIELEIVARASLPHHVAVVPAGYPETHWWQEPVWMTVCVDGSEHADR